MEKKKIKNQKVNFEMGIAKVGDVKTTEIKLIEVIKNLPRGSKINILPTGEMEILIG